LRTKQRDYQNIVKDKITRISSVISSQQTVGCRRFVEPIIQRGDIH
ncbi:3-phosphoshikimate 1-carboxyvinyltransferase, partial [Bienertia sinuspersici]